MNDTRTLTPEQIAKAVEALPIGWSINHYTKDGETDDWVITRPWRKTNEVVGFGVTITDAFLCANKRGGDKSPWWYLEDES